MGVLGDASASCGASGGATTPGSGSGVDLDTILDTSTGAGGDLLALFAAGLLAAGALFVRATRPAAATEGGGNR